MGKQEVFIDYISLRFYVFYIKILKYEINQKYI